MCYVTFVHLVVHIDDEAVMSPPPATPSVLPPGGSTRQSATLRRLPRFTSVIERPHLIFSLPKLRDEYLRSSWPLLSNEPTFISILSNVRGGIEAGPLLGFCFLGFLRTCFLASVLGVKQVYFCSSFGTTSTLVLLLLRNKDDRGWALDSSDGIM